MGCRLCGCTELLNGKQSNAASIVYSCGLHSFESVSGRVSWEIDGRPKLMKHRAPPLCRVVVAGSAPATRQLYKHGVPHPLSVTPPSTDHFTIPIRKAIIVAPVPSEPTPEQKSVNTTEARNPRGARVCLLPARPLKEGCVPSSG